MKLQIFILSVLNYVGLTNQHGRDETLDDTFDEWLLRSFLNSTYATYEDVLAPPCGVAVPGLSSLGLMVVYIIVFVFSMAGNSLVVCVVCYVEKGRTSTDIYLMHLAVADLLFSVTLPFWAVNAHYGWLFGDFMCKLLSGFQEASVYSGVFLLGCISVDRYFAIVRATRIFSYRHHWVKVVCCVVWLVAGLLSLPVATQRESISDRELGQTICFENLTGESIDRWRVGVRIMRHTVGFFLPLVVMAVCYGWTVVTLYHTRNQQKHKAMRVIVVVVMAFVLCWLPYNVTVLIDTLMRGELQVETCGARHSVEVMLHVTQVLAFTHCAVNPVLYAFIGEKFRNQLLSVLYKQGLISKNFQIAYRTGSISSASSLRSRHTSVTM